jgi:hypothetical protein
MLSREEYQALTRIASERGTQVHILIERLVRGALHLPEPLVIGSKPEPPKPKRKRKPYTPASCISDPSELRRLHAQGLNDREIGDILGMKSQRISYDRQFLGLEKNTVKGRKRIPR